MSDLARLPSDLGNRATVVDRGEAVWPRGDAERAVNALADAGLILLGIDYYVRDADGHRMQQNPVSLYEPDGNEDVERSRQRALEALRSWWSTEYGQEVVVVWQPSSQFGDAAL